MGRPAPQWTDDHLAVREEQRKAAAAARVATPGTKAARSDGARPCLYEVLAPRSSYGKRGEVVELCLTRAQADVHIEAGHLRVHVPPALPAPKAAPVVAEKTQEG